MPLKTVAPRLFRRTDGEAAFERLYERNVDGVFRYAVAMLGDAADAEDVTQTTFLNAYRAFQSGTRPDNPHAWLIAIAHNVCRQRFRQAQRRPREVAFDDGIGEPEVEEHTGPTAEDLRRALTQLPPNQRAALVMRELEGNSYNEIAGVLGVSVSALETLLFRARRSLREQLEEQLTCQEAALAISKQLDGRLGGGERRALRAHLRACSECNSFAQSQRAQRRALKSLVLVPLPLTIAHWSGVKSASAATSAGGLTAAGTTAGGAGVSSIFLGGAGIAAKVAAIVVAGVVVGGGTYEGVRIVRGSDAQASSAGIDARGHAGATSRTSRVKGQLASRKVLAARAGSHARNPTLVSAAATGQSPTVASGQRSVNVTSHGTAVDAGATTDATSADGTSSDQTVATMNATPTSDAGSNSQSGATPQSSGANPQAVSNPTAAANSQSAAHSQAASNSNAAAHSQAQAGQPASAKPDQGNAANAPGHADQPGNSGNAPGQADQPGNSANAPGHADQPGNSANAPGQSSQPGNSGSAPGHTDQPGNSANAPGHSDVPATTTTTTTTTTQGNGSANGNGGTGNGNGGTGGNGGGSGKNGK